MIIVSGGLKKFPQMSLDMLFLAKKFLPESTKIAFVTISEQIAEERKNFILNWMWIFKV